VGLRSCGVLYDRSNLHFAESVPALAEAGAARSRDGKDHSGPPGAAAAGHTHSRAACIECTDTWRAACTQANSWIVWKLAVHMESLYTPNGCSTESSIVWAILRSLSLLRLIDSHRNARQSAFESPNRI
jgi:hypothetical protein